MLIYTFGRVRQKFLSQFAIALHTINQKCTGFVVISLKIHSDQLSNTWEELESMRNWKKSLPERQWCSFKGWEWFGNVAWRLAGSGRTLCSRQEPYHKPPISSPVISNPATHVHLLIMSIKSPLAPSEPQAHARTQTQTWPLLLGKVQWDVSPSSTGRFRGSLNANRHTHTDARSLHTLAHPPLEHQVSILLNAQQTAAAWSWPKLILQACCFC